MDDLGKLLTIALGALAIATATGFGLQRGALTSLRDRLKDSDDELARKDRRLTEAEAEVKKLKTDLAALARVVTGEAHWIAIGERLEHHHERAETHWSHDEKVLEEIRDRLPLPPPRSS